MARLRELYDLHPGSDHSASDARRVIAADDAVERNSECINSIEIIIELLLCRDGEFDVILSHNEILSIIDGVSCA